LNKVRWDTFEAYTDKQHTGGINILPVVQDENNMKNTSLLSPQFMQLSEKEGYYHLNKIFDRIRIVDSINNNTSNFMWAANNRLGKTLNVLNFAMTYHSMSAGRLSSKWIRVKLGLQYNKITDIINKDKVKQTLFSIGSDVDIILR
jgi:hypothetical protein